MRYLFNVNLVEESIQTGESWTEKAELASCSCRNLNIKLFTTKIKINVRIAILITVI